MKKKVVRFPLTSSRLRRKRLQQKINSKKLKTTEQLPKALSRKPRQSEKRKPLLTLRNEHRTILTCLHLLEGVTLVGAIPAIEAGMGDTNFKVFLQTDTAQVLR